MIIVLGLMSNGLYFDFYSRIWLSTTGVEKRTSLSFQEALLMTLAKLMLNSSSSVYSLSPFFVSGVINSTIGDFIYKDEVALLRSIRLFVSNFLAYT